ncbi:MAG: type II CAAX endopeptidase family protein [Candidatus Methanoperedens sp.]|nr:type II CAAX endopeptidase family protein [Candidatus Methanoperedens sp.]
MISSKKRTLFFYGLIVFAIVVSSLSVLWVPPEYTVAESLKDSGGLVWLLPFLPLFAYMIMILLPIIYKRQEKEPLVWGHRFFKGAYLGFILMTMIFLIELASGLIRIEDTIPDIQSAIIGGIILQGIVALGEEMSFRGYILPDMAKRYGSWNAVIYSSFFFSLLHIPSVMTLNLDKNSIILMIVTITVAEILLAICYIYDGLSMSIGFHFTWNFFQYHVYSLRQDFGGGILKTVPEHQLITGGTFGPEAGFLGLFVVILALIVVFWWNQSR